MAARVLMSGVNLALFACQAGFVRDLGPLAVAAAAIGILLALTVVIDGVWLGPAAGWPVLHS